MESEINSSDTITNININTKIPCKNCFRTIHKITEGCKPNHVPFIGDWIHDQEGEGPFCFFSCHPPYRTPAFMAEPLVEPLMELEEGER